MIELYVVVTLFGLGYLIQQRDKDKVKPLAAPLNAKNIPQPSQRTPYDTRYLNTVAAVEKRAADSSYAKSLVTGSGVINRVPGVESKLAGVKFKESDFRHNNMTPYYRGNLKSNVKIDAFANRLEQFGAVYNDETMARKQERAPLFDVTKELSFVNGMPNRTNAWQQRLEEPKAKNNVLPFQQMRVGPGLNRGYAADPTGGFQQLDSQQYANTPNVDELRMGSNPKITYNSRIVDGLKGEKPSSVDQLGRVAKNRVETAWEQTEDQLLRTTGAYLKEAVIPVPEVKYTSRPETSQSYAGTAFKGMASETRPDIRDPHKTQLSSIGITNATLGAYGKGEGYDYGKDGILVYANARDTTTVQTYEGNITSIVKSIMAPLQDIMKVNKKELYVNNPREYGQLSAQIPQKLTVRDPNDVLRTTIKETMLDGTAPANMKGATRITVYDPNDIARTTGKQTMLFAGGDANLIGGAKRGFVKDPNDIARTTGKETMLFAGGDANLIGGAKYGVVKDPNDIARTTIKETNIHDAVQSNIRTGEGRGQARDPDVIARTTIRETTNPADTEVNMRPPVLKPTIYDPSDSARTTNKETTIDNIRQTGNINARERVNAAYVEETFDMKMTAKEQYADKDYYGTADRGKTDGYQVAPTDIKPTHKAILSQNDYFGGAADKTQFVQTSYEDMYNATIDCLKEDTLTGRDPTQTGVKVAVGGDTVNLKIRKNEYDDIDIYENRNPVTNEPIDANGEGIFTRQRQAYREPDVLDDIAVAMFQDNPYTQPLNSVA